MFSSLSFRTYFVGVCLLAFFLPYFDRVMGNNWVVTGLVVVYLVCLRFIGDYLEARKKRFK